MPQTEVANAEPTKQFFLEMFTRDISLEDCTLDLIDNSIDSHLLRNNINIASLVFGPFRSETRLGKIEVFCSSKEIRVNDRCGGIDYEDAKNYVFRFGHDKGATTGKLGAYGVGLKRAIFKMGNTIKISSRTTENGFDVDLDVDRWAARPEWSIPITPARPATTADSAGTDIRITDLRPEVKMRIQDGSLLKKLYEDVAQTYAFFLGKIIEVRVGTDKVDPDPIPIGESEDVKPARESFQNDGVKVTLVAAIAPPGKQRSVERAGWYILCNGRVVVSAEKTELTGWGVGVPSFHNKYTRFVGIALFESADPLRLPWTTTKRNVNRESVVYQRARNVMAGMTKPITTFLNSLYPQDPSETREGRELLGGIRSVELSNMASKRNAPFEVKKKAGVPQRRTAHVVYNVPMESMEKVRRCIGKANYSDSEVGKFTFNHYLKNECSD